MESNTNAIVVVVGGPRANLCTFIFFFNLTLFQNMFRINCFVEIVQNLIAVLYKHTRHVTAVVRVRKDAGHFSRHAFKKCNFYFFQKKQVYSKYEPPALRVIRAETRFTVYRPFVIVRMQRNRAWLVLEPICFFPIFF